MKRKIVFILLCVLLFLIVSFLSFVYFFFNTNKTNSDMSYEMRNVLSTELSRLERLLKEQGIITEEFSNNKTGQYWDDDVVRELDDATYMRMGFTYEKLTCEVYLLYRNNVYTVEFKFGDTDLNYLTDKTKDGAKKILDVFNEFCDTDSFSPNAIEKNYSESYFIDYYEKEKYDTQTTHNVKEMCSYEVIGEKESYTYFCSKYSSGELFPCQISITYDRTVDKELVLEKGGDSND